MIDYRSEVCGNCTHFRPAEGICGGVAPVVLLFGAVPHKNEESGEESIEPLYGTFRPEVREDDPCCSLFSPYGSPVAAEIALLNSAVPESKTCAFPGCKCMRDGESPWCVDHETPEDRGEVNQESKVAADE